MTFFSAAIRKESISLPMLSLFNYVQAFLCEISSMCYLKYPYSYFSSRFNCPVAIVLLFFLYCLCFFFLVAVIILSWFFFMLSWSPQIDAFTPSSSLASPLPLIIDKYSLSISSSFVLLSSSPFVEVPSSFIPTMVPCMLLGRHPKCLYFHEITATALGFVKFYRSTKILFLFFFL